MYNTCSLATKPVIFSSDPGLRVIITSKGLDYGEFSFTVVTGVFQWLVCSEGACGAIASK